MINHMVGPPRRIAHAGFTLIELLVVISIIALLIGILVPALGAARNTARVATCLSREHQLALGVSTYAADYKDLTPRGPRAEPSFIAISFGASPTPGEDQVMSSVILNAAFGIGALPAGTVYFNSHGALLDGGYLTDAQAMFCPGDDTTDPFDELEKVRSKTPRAFSSYLYRNLDQAPLGRLSHMGDNDLGEEAGALFLDSNSVWDAYPDTFRTNHGNDPVNVAYIDGHAKSFRNDANPHVFSLIATDYMSGFNFGIEPKYNLMLQAADADP